MAHKKPDIAKVLERKGRENLERKVAWLTRGLEGGVDLSKLPTSQRKFNGWTLNTGELSERFEKNANETLLRHPDLLNAVRVLTAKIKAAAKPAKSTRDIGLGRAREQTNLHLTIRRIAEIQIVRLSTENETLRREVRALRSQVEAIAAEARNVRLQLEKELADVKSSRSERSGKSVTRLSVVKPNNEN